MMSLPSASILGVLLSLGLAEPTDYVLWASFQPGATASYKQTGVVAGKTIDSDWIYLLMDATPEKAIVEAAATHRTKGETVVSRLELPAFCLIRKREILREGFEERTVESRALWCRWVESREGPDLTMKEWISDEIPGGLVRREVTWDGERKAKTVLALSSWKGVRKQ